MISLNDLSSKLKKEKNVALICHIRPDGDTLGSALALSFALNNLGIVSDVFCDDSVPSRFFFLNSASLVKKQIDKEYSAIIAIDCADITRLGNYGEFFLSHKNTYSIDHHISNTRYAKYNYVVDNASNCENIYSIIKEAGVEITEEIAPDLSDEETEVLSVMDGETHVDKIAELTGKKSFEIITILSMLEINGVVSRGANNCYTALIKIKK